MARRKLGVLALPFGGPSNRQERHEARKRPPLAIFIPTLDGGGAERIVLHLARGFQEVGLATDIVVMRNEGAYRDQVPPGVRVVALGSKKTWLSVLDLARYLRRERPERVYATMDDANLVALLARFLVPHRVRIVCGIHNTPSLALDTRSNWRNATKVALLRLLYPQAAAVVAVSQGAAANSRRMFRLDSDQVTVIPNPVLTPELAKLAEAPVRHPWFQSGGPPVVLACGRLTGQKDYPNLLQAFAILRQHREVRLVILGEGEARPELEHLRHQLGLEGSVDLPGFAANPYAYMARCDLYVLSSRFEGSPVVLVEALACGARIVATDCPSGPAETLAGVEGSRLVPVDNSAALARAMAVMLDEAAPRPGVRHLARFDYRAAARRYLELLP